MKSIYDQQLKLKIAKALKAQRPGFSVHVTSQYKINIYWHWLKNLK